MLSSSCEKFMHLWAVVSVFLTATEAWIAEPDSISRLKSLLLLPHALPRRIWENSQSFHPVLHIDQASNFVSNITCEHIEVQLSHTREFEFFPCFHMHNAVRRRKKRNYSLLPKSEKILQTFEKKRVFHEIMVNYLFTPWQI
ncbi:uncharacterized protein LOC108671999 [Hyalella azteca]|uniref:Uncharacterized protein LOC108671999 n=1 Tax=Hyalella azteca TaxID=294128 RepID=A0A8B7NN42_HYAAZ|nr:uncharacterized protein LOC108671999 [Hyalella azteca]XP_018015100.1 uncharacterized protein LOC108671999 [Hyalella azteca]